MNNFDKVVADVMVYAHPECLMKQYITRIDKTGVDDGELERYLGLLMILSQALKKVKRYEVYFTEFYPDQSGQISSAEALEHHLHAYLEDVDSLKDKVKTFLDVLTKDVRRANNGKEWVVALKHIKGQLYKVFNGIAECRVPHHHTGMRFADADLVDASVFATVSGDSSPFKDRMRPEAVDHFKRKIVESFELAQKRWIGIAASNQVQIDGALDQIFGDIRDLLYQHLRIEPFVDVAEVVTNDK
ncbi:hypothetical protein A3K24_00480 [candidate division Kazan bacterium RIFCSPHIGHO2_01_FULL_44_14]|uniref:Uncharacterized protein n=1 Tax=candidate division Kazan bacterium RIFCSPLOWO2_01_FULL_45_19 TaxID=1798538 RepID=A0A1F4NPG1_UNCK3|nr:MAG: hypothetical protein A3K51_00480 [candidate division Kazan bacterium RIFCSPLOWO2_01_FULL_45_19]OGB77588.1 MAG: hypothetical protein A3K24_00480 [candidate division Kazan bacterium RIFCSPHIGHO2_01_FULL_44_14]